MNKHTPIQLGDHYARFVEDQVVEGHFASASDVVEAALQLLEENKAKIDALRAALIEGEESGFDDSFDFDEFIAAKRRK